MYLISRLRIAALSIVSKLMHFPKPISFVGPDSSLSLCREIAGTGIKRIVLITDGPLFKLGVVDPIAKALRDAGLTVEVFSEIEPDPGYEMIAAGVERLRQAQAQAVLAVGGGSSIDGAKAMVACYANHCHPSQLVGLFKVSKAGVPFYAIPTTAGTGSEVTMVAVVSDKKAKLKHALIDPKLVPLMVALDAKLTAGLPPAITAATGMDALTHAVEAYISTLATPETDQLARSAAAAIVRRLPQAYADGKDLMVRERMAIGSFMAGLAFTRTGVGYVHAIAHQLGALYHVPHGLANAVVLPHVLDLSKPACAHRLADLARCCAIGPATAGDQELAALFIAHIRTMNSGMGIPEKIKELRREDFGVIVDRAFKEAHGTYGVPRYFSRTECEGLLQRLQGM